MVGGPEVTPPPCPWRQGLDVSSCFLSKNVVLDVDLGLVRGEPFVRGACLGKVSFSGLLTCKMRTRTSLSLRVALT